MARETTMVAAREPQDRKAPTRRRTSRATQADQTAGQRTEVDTEDTEGYVAVEFQGRTYRVRPAEEWRQSTNDALSDGRANDWAADVMPREDYEAWLDLDPTNREFGDFMEEMGRQVGMSLGESGPSNRALRRMRRR